MDFPERSQQCHQIQLLGVITHPHHFGMVAGVAAAAANQLFFAQHIFITDCRRIATGITHFHLGARPHAGVFPRPKNSPFRNKYPAIDGYLTRAWLQLGDGHRTGAHHSPTPGTPQRRSAAVPIAGRWACRWTWLSRWRDYNLDKRSTAAFTVASFFAKHSRNSRWRRVDWHRTGTEFPSHRALASASGNFKSGRSLTAE